MSEVSKVHTGPSIQSNVTHVEGVESSSICTIRAVMLCMSKVSKVAQNNWGLLQGYAYACQRCQKNIHMFLLITFLIINWLSICKKFWKAETWGFPTIPSNSIYVRGVEGYFDLRHHPTCFNIHSIWWYGWKALSLSFPKLFADWKLVEYQESYE